MAKDVDTSLRDLIMGIRVVMRTAQKNTSAAFGMAVISAMCTRFSHSSLKFGAILSCSFPLQLSTSSRHSYLVHAL